MKIIVLIFIFLFSISCSNVNEFEGFWHGERIMKNDNNVYPMLLKFENNTYIDYFSRPDTIEYKSFGNNLFITYKQTTNSYRIKYKLYDSELKFIDSKTDSIIAKLEKSNKQNYLFDFVSDKSLHFDLPNGKGIEKRYGYNYRFKEPLYITYKNNKLFSYFRGKTKLVDKDFYKFILDNIINDFDYWENIPISLIADKKVKISDINVIKNHLRLAGYKSIHYLMHTEKYDNINLIALTFHPLSTDELKTYQFDDEKYLGYLASIDDELDFILFDNLQKAKTNFDKKHSILLDIDKSKLKLNNRIITESELKKAIQNRQKNNPDFIIFYHISDDSNYQDFIRILDITYNESLDLRNEFLREKYNINNKFHKWNKERIKESKYKYPFRFWEIDIAEYNDIEDRL